MNENKLKECPFCGSASSLEEIKSSDDKISRWAVGCDNSKTECIGYQSLTTFSRKIDAIAAWNLRPKQPVVEEHFQQAIKSLGVCDDEFNYWHLDEGNYF